MKILLVSGFLGAGKTTFIKELLKKSGRYLVILENEYGQNNIDGQELRTNGTPDLKLLEFMEGCVCCTKKDTFSNTILTISAGIDPEYLVVEPTGIGRLSNIIAAIDKVSYNKIQLLKPVVILAPRSFEKNMAEFGDIYQDQIRFAGRVLFSKAETEDPALLASVSQKIRAINPTVEIVSQHYSIQEKEWWDGLFLAEGEARPDAAEVEQDDSNVMEVSLQSAALTRPAELIMLLEDLLRGEFGLVTRAKGVLKVGGEWLRFDMADNLYAIIQETAAEPKTQCVFIGREVDKGHLCDRLNSYDDIFVQADKIRPASSLSPRQRVLQRGRQNDTFS